MKAKQVQEFYSILKKKKITCKLVYHVNTSLHFFSKRFWVLQSVKKTLGKKRIYSKDIQSWAVIQIKYAK